MHGIVHHLPSQLRPAVYRPLNCNRTLGQALEEYRKTHRSDAFALRKEFPALDSLEDALAEWMMGGVAERTAYQVMAAVELRSPTASVEDRLNAMIGAVAPQFDGAHASAEIHPANLFMQACEAKGDYSFIYASTERSTTPGRTWQPVPGMLTAVLSWHSSGDGQRGVFRSDHLELHGMAHASPGRLSQEASQFIADWLASGANTTSAEMPQRVLRRLRQAGFSGSGEHVELMQGLFFPQGRTPPGTAAIAIAAGVRWAFGAPALVLLPRAANAFSFGDVGVVVGPVPSGQASVSIV